MGAGFSVEGAGKPHTLLTYSYKGREQAKRLSPLQESADQFISATVENLSDWSSIAALPLAGGLLKWGKAVPSVSVLRTVPQALGVRLGLLSSLAALAVFTGCVPTGPDISVSEIRFNEEIKGDLGPANEIDRRQPRFMNDGKNSRIPLSEFYPDWGSEALGRMREGRTFWMSKKTIEQSSFRISWELIFGGFEFAEPGYATTTPQFRGCLGNGLTDPETGARFQVIEPDGNKPGIAAAIAPLYQETVSIQVCSPEQDCELHDARELLGIGNPGPQNKQRHIGCFINGQLPKNLITTDIGLTLFFSDTASPDRPFHKLSPDLHVIEGCRTLPPQNLTYRYDLSAEEHPVPVGPGNQLFYRLFWCWRPEETSDRRLSQNFDPHLHVAEVKNFIERGKDDRGIPNDELIRPRFIRLGVKEGTLGLECEISDQERGAFDLTRCERGELRATPSYFHDEPETPLNWCIEERIPQKPDGSYEREPQWTKEDPLKMQFLVCESE